MLSDEGKVIEVNVPAHLMDRVHLKSFIEGHTSAHDIIHKEREEKPFQKLTAAQKIKSV